MIDGLEDHRKQIGVEALTAKLEALSVPQWFAVIDACDRVGGGTYHVDAIAGELKRVGLVR